MTAETSNARGLVEYEYEVWQGDAWQAGGSTTDYAAAQSEASHYAMIFGQDGPVEVRIYEKRLLSVATPPAAARGGVRGLVEKWRERCGHETAQARNKDLAEWARDRHHGAAGAFMSCVAELQEALAAEGVRAGEVEQRARGELRVADIREDAREPLQLLREKLAHDEDGWAALCRLMPMLAAAPQPADAEPKTLPVPTRVYLTDKAAVIVGDPQCGWDEEGPDAHNCDAMGCASIGPHVLARVPFTDERALSQPAEARGVVDEGSRIVTSQLLHWGGIPVHVTGTVTTSPSNWPLIDAALTEARNVR